MRQTDQMLARYAAEIEERQAFIDGLVEDAETNTRDLTTQEMELLTRARDRITELNAQMAPLADATRIGVESRERLANIAALAGPAAPRQEDVVFRSAGEYAIEMWRAGLGNTEARERLALFNRAAAHQTTADNPGLLPEQIIGPVVNFIDESRPVVGVLGPRPLPSGSWARPRITQHTQIGQQTAEKTELASRKMTITKTPVNAATYGGYVNVSRQDIDWTTPAIMDIVIGDLAGQYALETENACADLLTTSATAGPGVPATPTNADVAKAVWAAAGAVYAACKGAGRLVLACSPDMLGLIGPLFAPVNPTNAQSSGFQAGQFGQGVMGAISGITTVVSAGLNAGTILVFSTAAAEVYENRVGQLQVVEPSVLGVQVAYAGYFTTLIMAAAGIIKIAVGP